jgi:hypothetical protein
LCFSTSTISLFVTGGWSPFKPLHRSVAADVFSVSATPGPSKSSKFGRSHCRSDSTLSPDAPILINSPVLFQRFHGVPRAISSMKIFLEPGFDDTIVIEEYPPHLNKKSNVVPQFDRVDRPLIQFPVHSLHPVSAEHCPV